MPRRFVSLEASRVHSVERVPDDHHDEKNWQDERRKPRAHVILPSAGEARIPLRPYQPCCTRYTWGR